MKSFRFYLGLLLILAGTVFLFSSFIGIVGFVVFDGTEKVAGSALGIVLIVVGILMMMAREGSSKLEETSEASVRLEPTERFEKAIRRYDLNRINAALKKIGTGLGKQHQLTTGDHSISVSKGGRILYHYDNTRKTATLLDYDASHDYNKLLRGRR